MYSPFKRNTFDLEPNQTKKTLKTALDEVDRAELIASYFATYTAYEMKTDLLDKEL